MLEKEFKRGGKKQEPTREELEFIYEHLSSRSNKDIVDDIDDETTFPPRSIGFIKRRRKEFEVAQQVIRKQFGKSLDPVQIELRKEHWVELATMARELERALRGARKYELVRGEKIDEGRLRDWDQFMLECLLAHVRFEKLPLNHLNSWYDVELTDVTDELLKILLVRAANKDFKGKCEVCKSWSY